MSFNGPTAAELRTIAEGLGLEASADELEELRHLMAPVVESYRTLETLPEPLPGPAHPDRPCHFPEEADNPYGAWYVRTEIPGAGEGPLAGRTVAVKDNIFLAGVPMTGGAAILEGFVPDFDATVVTRLLDAGATITGKSVCECLCVSGGSFTASTGIVGNPWNPAYSTGGSSSGSAALVAAGEVDLAIGTDQGGSVRAPAAWTGTVGMKATHGLVPYTGGLPMEIGIDHIGPITADVADNATMLEVLAGDDGLDARQCDPRIERYVRALTGEVSDLRIGVVGEGFGHPLADADVDAAVRAAAGRLADLGARVEEVSVPAHRQGTAIWLGLVLDGFWRTISMGGLGYNWEGVYSPALHAHLAGWQARLGELPGNVRLFALFGRYLERYQGRYYARARNQVRWLGGAYDAALAEHDLLLMPTTVQKASRNPPSLAEATLEQVMELAFNNTFNTCQFNATGHPAISVPCALGGGLPIGAMLIGPRHGEANLYRAAHALEQARDWRGIAA